MTKNKTKKEEPVKLNMTFEQAMKKALNTPLPKTARTLKKNIPNDTPRNKVKKK